MQLASLPQPTKAPQKAPSQQGVAKFLRSQSQHLFMLSVPRLVPDAVRSKDPKATNRQGLADLPSLLSSLFSVQKGWELQFAPFWVLFPFSTNVSNHLQICSNKMEMHSQVWLSAIESPNLEGMARVEDPTDGLEPRVCVCINSSLKLSRLMRKLHQRNYK